MSLDRGPGVRSERPMKRSITSASLISQPSSPNITTSNLTDRRSLSMRTPSQSKITSSTGSSASPGCRSAVCRPFTSVSLSCPGPRVTPERSVPPSLVHRPISASTCSPCFSMKAGPMPLIVASSLSEVGLSVAIASRVLLWATV